MLDLLQGLQNKPVFLEQLTGRNRQELRETARGLICHAGEN